jgi:diguanylate cyclase (GGDEF)-like protein
MHRHVFTAEVNTPVRECASRISSEHIGCLIILNRGRPEGIITERDFVELVRKGGADVNRMKAADIMSTPLISVGPDTAFSEAMRIFDRKGIRRMPVVHKGGLVGLLTLKSMSEYANLSLTRQNQKLRNETSMDSLTGVLNKAAITSTLRKEYERIRRFGGRTSILFLDIDHFKRINDQYSHLAGDAVLRELGRLFKSTCREIDTVGRYGGEEFLIIAPNRKKYHAIQFGERLRKAVEDHVFAYKGLRLRLTVSLGIASLFEGRDYIVTLERADKALYHAKHMGRNRIGLWREGKLAIAEEHAAT